MQYHTVRAVIGLCAPSFQPMTRVLERKSCRYRPVEGLSFQSATEHRDECLRQVASCWKKSISCRRTRCSKTTFLSFLTHYPDILFLKQVA